MDNSAKRKQATAKRPPGVVSPRKEKGRVVSDKFQKDMKQFMDGFDEPNVDNLDDERELASKMTKARMLEEINTFPAGEARKLLMKLLSESPGVRETLRRELVKFRLGPDPGRAKRTRSSSKGKKAAPFEWMGSYDVYSPGLEAQFDQADGPLKFTFIHSLGSSHLWALFDIGEIKGVIRSIDPPPRAAGDKITFVWRGRETGRGEGEMHRDEDDCRGVVVFLEDAMIQGSMLSDGIFTQFDFFGKLEANMTRLGRKEHRRKIEEMKDEWRALCWSMERPDSPADSDTSWGSAGEGEGEGEDSDDGGRSDDSGDSDEEREGGSW